MIGVGVKDLLIGLDWGTLELSSGLRILRKLFNMAWSEDRLLHSLQHTMHFPEPGKWRSFVWPHPLLIYP